MAEISSVKNDLNNFIEENSFKEKTNSSQKNRKCSLNSSKSESFFSNLNAEIKSFIENDEDLSFSSESSSESQDQQINIEYLLDYKYWRANKDFNSEKENQIKKDIFFNKNNILLNENIKEKLGQYDRKLNFKKDQLMVSIGSNKQSTQSNEDEETRIEHLHNISDSESNNSPLNSLSNNESEENEINCDKLSNKENEEKQRLNNLEKNNETKNALGKDLLRDRFQVNKNEFGIPFQPINYMNNKNKNNNTFFFQGAFPTQPLCSSHSQYNLSSPLGKNINSINNNNSSKINYNYSENKDEGYNKKENKLDVNRLDNKFINECDKKNIQNQKEITDLPLIINQNNNQNIPANYNSSKLNLNITYYPKIQSGNISTNKQSLDKIDENSKYLPELNKRDILSEKKLRSNLSNYEDKNNSVSNINFFNNMNNNKLKLNYKNIIIIRT